MNYQKAIAVGISVVLLAGCAKGNKAERVVATNGSEIAVDTFFAPPDMNSNHYADQHLRVVEAKHTGAMLGLNAVSVVGLALLGGISTGSTFSKDGLKGEQIDSLPEPSEAVLFPKVKVSLNHWLTENGGGYHYKETLHIAPSRWLLVYKALSDASQGYELRYNVVFYKKREDGNVFSSFISGSCAPAPQSAPLVDWQKDNYALVKSTTGKYMDECLKEFEQQLPVLLKQKG